ncbi:MAG: hypothetical protein ABIN48_10905 [Ginsengibacter sp.]
MQLRFLVFIILFPFQQLFAQNNAPLPKDLSGVWAGYMFNDTTQLNTDFELAISEEKGKFNGYTYTVFLIDEKKNMGVKAVKIKEKKGVLLIEDDKLIDHNYDAPPAKGVRAFMQLHYSENDSVEILQGPWKTNITREYNSVTGKIHLERKKKIEETAIIPKLRQLDLLKTLSFVPRSGNESLKANIAATQSPETLKELTPIASVSRDEKSNNTVSANKRIKAEPEKIIPDTTIVNPEITIFMYPKKDTALVDNTKNEIEKALLANAMNDSALQIATRKKGNEPVLSRVENTVKSVPSKPDSPAENNLSVAAVSQDKRIPAEMLSKREIETIKTVEITRDTLIFSLFDNGVIDGDTVSVLLNGKVIMSRVGLLARAYNDTIYITPEMGDSINIILYAENLGSIPPNTGLLVVRDGKVNHEIRFSGDLKKNSAIILKRKRNLHGK